MSNFEDIRSAFIKAAIWHGTLDEAEEILAKHPNLATNDIHIAAILGDDKTVQKFIEEDTANAIAISEPFGGNALIYLCMSKYLSLKQRPEEGFLRAATLLLDAGTDVNFGFGNTEYINDVETPLYGASGVAHNANLTRLLLERGADPNDIEAVYHSPETYDNGAMEVLVNTGKITPVNLSLMLIRKHDFHDYDGAKFLLENGTDPNVYWRADVYPIHHALARGNRIEIIELLLDHGAKTDVLDKNNLTAIAHAAREGRGDVLELFKKRGIELDLQGADLLIAACAMNDAEQITKIVNDNPNLVNEVKAMSGNLISRFAGNGNPDGIKQLLDLGLNVNAAFEGDAYFGTPAGSLPIHVAAWKGYPTVVKLMIERGTIIDQPDANGETPLMLAVKATVNSYWMYRRSPDSVEALLQAGASAKNVAYSCGYAEVDKVLEKYR